MSGPSYIVRHHDIEKEVNGAYARQWTSQRLGSIISNLSSASTHFWVEVLLGSCSELGSKLFTMARVSRVLPKGEPFLPFSGIAPRRSQMSPARVVPWTLDPPLSQGYFLFILFFIYEYFVCMHVCAPHE